MNLVRGIGINDIPEPTRDIPAYKTWATMLDRCTNPKRYPKYIGCTIAPEWLHLSKFSEWYDEHHVEGWHMDKDLLIEGNREYGPKGCNFVPPNLNKFNPDKVKRCYVVHGDKFRTVISKYGKTVHVGLFDTIEEAQQAHYKAVLSYFDECCIEWGTFPQLGPVIEALRGTLSGKIKSISCTESTLKY